MSEVPSTPPVASEAPGTSAPPETGAAPAEPETTVGEGTTTPAEERDPLHEIRAGLGLPQRSGGTPISSNLDVTLRRLGIGMLILGTSFLLLWRILSWVNA